MKMGKWQIKIGLAAVAILAIYLAYKKKLGPFGDPAIMDLFNFGKDKAPLVPELVVGGDPKSPNAFQGPSTAIGTGNLTTPLTKPDEDVRQTFMREMYKQTYLPFSEYPFLYDNPSYLNPNNPTGVPVRGGDLPNCAPTDDAWYDMWYKLYGFYPPASTATNCNPAPTPPIPEVINPEPIPIPDADPGGWENCGINPHAPPCCLPPTSHEECKSCAERFGDACGSECDNGNNMTSENCIACRACFTDPNAVCRSGYSWDAATSKCVRPPPYVPPPPPPKPYVCKGPPKCKSSCSKASCNILTKWKELACRFTREADAVCPGRDLGGKIKCKVKTAIAEAWVKNYANQYKKCGAGNMSYHTRAGTGTRTRTRVYSTPGVGYAFYGTQRPIGEIIQSARGIAIA